MASTARRESKRLRAQRRRAAYHADRARRAGSPAERFRAAEYALVSAAKHARNPARAAQSVLGDITEHARRAITEAGLSGARARLFDSKLAATGSELARLSTVLMCLRGAIAHLPGPERNRLYEHYARELTAEADRINSTGGDR